MPPDSKTPGNIRPDGYGEKTRQQRTSDSQQHRCQRTGTHKRDNEKCDEKNKSRAKVPNQGEGDNTGSGKENEGIQIPLHVKSIKGRSTHINIQSLYQF